MLKSVLKKFKWQIVLTALLLSLTLGIISFCWFYTQSELGSLTAVTKPSAFSIKGDAEAPLAGIELSSIDVSEGEGTAQFLFCVCADGLDPGDGTRYDLGIAHTTHINFDYKLYKASLAQEDGFVLYEGQALSQDYYYNNLDELEITELNVSDPPPEPKTALRDDDYFDVTYGTETGISDRVQKNSIPIYGVVSGCEQRNNVDGHLADYFVLEVSWDSGMTKSKETDMIYLFVQTAAQSIN